MTLFAVFEPRPSRAPAIPEVVGDKFSWLAALLPPVFALRHRLWLEFVGFFIVLGALWFVSRWLGQGATLGLYAVMALWIGHASSSFLRNKLLREGWSYRGEVTASSGDLVQLAWLNRGGPR